MTNRLIIIGDIGTKRAYLNVPMDEAVRRYTVSEGQAPGEGYIQEFEFDDEFTVYDAWSTFDP